MILCYYGTVQFESRRGIEVRIKILEVAVILALSATLACMTVVPVKAQPFVRVYVYQPQGYIPGQPEGEKVTVDVIIEVSGIFDNTPEGIVGWGMEVQVDPDVLDPYAAKGASFGYLLYDFAMDYGYTTPTLLQGTIDHTTGYWGGLMEQIMPIPPGGAGESYTLYTLVTLEFYSKSETAFSSIRLIDVEYYTADGVWRPVDEVVDGNYNPPETPEFPLGVAFEILFIPVVIYILWRSKQRKKALT